LLGQRTDGKLLRHSENRTRAPGLLPNPGCRPARLVRLHRRILYPDSLKRRKNRLSCGDFGIRLGDMIRFDRAFISGIERAKECNPTDRLGNFLGSEDAPINLVMWTSGRRLIQRQRANRGGRHPRKPGPCAASPPPAASRDAIWKRVLPFILAIEILAIKPMPNGQLVPNPFSSSCPEPTHDQNHTPLS
jgi:hypothetical protein